MKMNEFYAAPEVEIVDVMVERGFNWSDPGVNDNGNNGQDLPPLY